MSSEYVDHGRRHKRKGTDPSRDGAFKVVVYAKDQAWTTGDDQGPPFFIPDDLPNTKLDTAEMAVKTPSSSGMPTVQIRNMTTGIDMLSTKITIDVGDKRSRDATTRSVIARIGIDEPLTARVQPGDEIAIDIDGAGAGTKGLVVMLGFS